jgi:hexokinase
VVGRQQVVRAVAHRAADLAAALVLADVQNRRAVLTERAQLFDRDVHRPVLYPASRERNGPLRQAAGSSDLF